MRRSRLFAALLILSALSACGKSGAAGSSSRDEGVVEFAGKKYIVSDRELESFVAWWRDSVRLAGHHRAEFEEVSRRIQSKYSLQDAGKISRDAELLALLDRQRREANELDQRQPVRDVKLQALGATVPGVATIEAGADGMRYVRGHDEILLSAARKKYGDAFVDWVLSKEPAIVRIVTEPASRQ